MLLRIVINGIHDRFDRGVLHVELRVGFFDQVLDFVGVEVAGIGGFDFALQIFDVGLVIFLGGIKAHGDEGRLVHFGIAMRILRIALGFSRVFEGVVFRKRSDIFAGTRFGGFDVFAIVESSVSDERAAFHDDEVDAFGSGIATNGKDDLSFFVGENVFGVATGIFYIKDVLGVVLETGELRVIVI